MKKFLILQLRPEDETADNEFQAILKYGQLSEDQAERVRVEQAPIPDFNLDDYAGIIVGGSPFDKSKPEDEKSNTQKRVEQDFTHLLSRVIEKDFPFLGACSGCGLLGDYCGVKISGKYGEPVGGMDVTLTDEGKKDPLCKGLPDTFRVLLGHKEACDAVPPEAVLLASSKTCPVQMFRIGKNVYATQFHPEADPEGFAVRIHVYKDYGYFPPETADELLEVTAGEETPYAQEILRRFIERYR